MSVLEQIKARKESMGRLELDVPEWGVTLYFPPFTGHEHKHMSVRESTEPADLAAKFITERAELEDGSKAFEKGDRLKLIRTAEFHVLTRILNTAWDWTPSDLDPEGSSQAQTST